MNYKFETYRDFIVELRDKGIKTVFKTIKRSEKPAFASIKEYNSVVLFTACESKKSGVGEDFFMHLQTLSSGFINSDSELQDKITTETNFVNVMVTEAKESIDGLKIFDGEVSP